MLFIKNIQIDVEIIFNKLYDKFKKKSFRNK